MSMNETWLTHLTQSWNISYWERKFKFTILFIFIVADMIAIVINEA